jgi:predicted amino acid-binding ACT domain protein
MALLDWQFIGIVISIIVSVVGSAVGATAWITWKMAKADTEIKNLRENLKKAEDDITYMFRLDHQEARKAAEKLRNDLSKSTSQSQAGDEEG